MSDKLPSIDNLPESKLPSVDEFIVEEKELPSIDEFVEKEEEVTEEPPDNAPCSIEEEAQDLTEIVRLINDVRKDIPDIPEIKYYDEELEKLTEQIEEVRNSIPEPPEIPEIKYYDEEIASLREEINQNAADIPEIKYYDEQVNDLEQKINVIKEAIVSLPEPKYYETDLESLKEDILAVKESIPVFPKWVNEVNQVPDFSWIGKTFGVIDDDFSKVNDHINDLKDKFDDDINHLTEDLDKKDFEKRVSIDKITEDLKEAKDKIYKELREAAVRINDTRHSFKNDDRLLKKDILGKLNVLKQRVEEEVKEFNRKNTEAKDIFDGYFTALTEEIANLPKPKNYDDKFRDLRKDVKSDVSKLSKQFEDTTVNISELYKIVENIKGEQQLLLETNVPLGEDPPETSNKDPLTPIDQNFVTLEQLQKHYKLFVERVQYQLGSIGGGGAGFIKDLDDVTFEQNDNELLIYNASTSKWVGIASTALSGSTTLDEVLTKGNVSGIGMSVGVITATNGYFSGIVTAAQLNYDVVTDIYSTGIVTATKGIQQTGNEGLHVTAGVSTFVGLTSCLGGLHVRAGSAVTSLIVEGDGRITGILTIGTGSITLDAANNKVNVGTGITLDAAAGTIEVYNTTTEQVSTVVNPSGEANYTGIVTATGGVHVGTAATIYANGNISCGIITATNFIGDGSGLTGVANTDNVVSTTLSVSGVVTAIGGLYVGTAASIYSNGNVTAGIITATKYYGDGSSLSNVTSTTINNNANNRLITGSGTANTLEGESTLTYDGAALSVSTGATIFTNGNITAGIITATSFTVGGTSLAETIADTVGGMVSSNTESGITVAYQDADNTLDFTVGTLNQDTTGTAALAEGLTGNPTITVTKVNVGTAATIHPTGGITAGIVTATSFVGPLTGNVTGNASGSSGSCTGNAATATALETARNIGGVSFDGSANINLPGVNTAGDQDTSGNATTATTATTATNITVSANNSTDETVYPIFVDGATGGQGAETDTGLTYNPNSGTLTASVFSGSGASLTNIPGIPSESDTAVSSTSATTVATISASTYRAAMVDVVITQGSAYQAGQYGLIHDGTTATIVEKFAIATGSMLGTFTATISGGNMLMQVNMGSSSSATVTVKAHTITV